MMNHMWFTYLNIWSIHNPSIDLEKLNYDKILQFSIMIRYKSVKVPEELVNEILRLIEEHKELGYRTHTEFIIESIRKRIEEIKKIIK